MSMNKTEFAVVGKPVRKIDGVELVTGKAKFAGDMKFPGMLYGYQRRAGVPAGKLTGIDGSDALKKKGVTAIFTAQDLLGPNLVGILPPFDQPLLAVDEIRYTGESVALVVGETREDAKKGAAAIKITIDTVQPILTIEEALKPEARKIHEQGNITFSKKLTKGDAAAAFAAADVIVENTYETSFQDHAYIEPEVVCAVPSGDGRVTIHASCQSPFHIRGHIAANLNLPASRVKVVQAYTGGSFGGKDDVAVEIGVLAATAALKLGRPVMINHERGNQLPDQMCVTHRRSAIKRVLKKMVRLWPGRRRFSLMEGHMPRKAPL